MVAQMHASPCAEHVLHVLVVDDNRDAADSLCVLLRLWGHDCRAAYDGAAGLDLAAAYRPECLILDIAMPHLDGYDLARQVRHQPGLETSKLIALTAFSDEGHVRRAHEAGFDYYLTKPADATELEGLLKMLHEVMKITSKTEQLARENVALASQTKELLREVKSDIQEVKAGLQEVKEELREAREAWEKAGPEVTPDGGPGPP
jgi:DNA-binding response OmpR family regulator